MTGLIMGGIVAIWILVLVPMWLNRHEADDAGRSVDSFSAAMRVLSRRGPSSNARHYVVMPRREDWGPTVDNHPDAKLRQRQATRRPAKMPAPERPGRASASAVSAGTVPSGAASSAKRVARRRRNALALLVLTVAVSVGATLGLDSWWFALALLLTTAGYLVHLRSEAIRAREERQRRIARTTRARSAVADEVGGAVGARARSADAYADAPRRATQAVDPAPVGDDVLLPPAVSASGTDNGSRWEPVPVPLPTYVSKPVVQRPAASAPRADVESGTIDLTRPGEWSKTYDDAGETGDVRSKLVLDESGSGRIASSPNVAAGAGGADVEDDELDLILNRRRAVGD